MIRLFVEYGADLDRVTPKGWTALQYARAKGKYGAPEEKGVYPEVWFGWRRGAGRGREREKGRGRRGISLRRKRCPLATRQFFFLSFGLLSYHVSPLFLSYSFFSLFSHRTSSSTTAPPSTARGPRPSARAPRASPSTRAAPSSCASAGPTRSRSRTREKSTIFFSLLCFFGFVFHPFKFSLF